MSYLYKKPVHHSAEPNRADPLKGSVPKTIPATDEIAVNETIMPSIPEKIDVIGSSHIVEISYEEHLKNLELMCKMDREFMKRVRLFCEENKEQNFPDVEAKCVAPRGCLEQPIQHPEPASQHEEGSE